MITPHSGRSEFHLRCLKKVLRATAARENKGATKWEAKALPSRRTATYVMMATYQFEHEKFLMRKADDIYKACRDYLAALNVPKDDAEQIAWTARSAAESGALEASNTGELLLNLAAQDQFAPGNLGGELMREDLQSAFESKDFDAPLVQRMEDAEVLTMAAPTADVLKHVKDHLARKGRSSSASKPKGASKGKKKGGGSSDRRKEYGKGRWCGWGENCNQGDKCPFEFHGKMPKKGSADDGAGK